MLSQRRRNQLRCLVQAPLLGLRQQAGALQAGALALRVVLATVDRVPVRYYVIRIHGKDMSSNEREEEEKDEESLTRGDLKLL